MQRNILILVLASSLALVGCSKPKKTVSEPHKAAVKAEQAAAPQAEQAAAEPAEAKEAAAKAKAASRAKVEASKYEGTVAHVNGEPISGDDFTAEISKVVKPGSKVPAERLKRIESNILTRMIDDRLVKQAIKAEGVAISDKEFDAEYQRYKARFKTPEQYENFLKYGRMTEEQVRERVREKAALKKLLKDKFGLGVTQEEIQTFYEKNNRFYKERATVEIKQIVLRVPKKSSPDQVKAVEEKVKKVQAALHKRPFEEVAKEFSEDLSRDKGGAMEPITRGRYLKAVEDVAFSMKPAEISKPIKTQVGYHIVKLVKKSDERLKSFDEVKDQISETLSNRNFYSAKRKLIDSLKKDAKVERLIGEPEAKKKKAPAKAKASAKAPAKAPAKPEAAPTSK